MLADRGEKLEESVGLIQRALQIEPDNGSYLDSLGWAYYKIGKLDLAETHLKRAADQLITNSVVQDHYGDVLARMGRFEQAIAAWNRALTGDGDSIDRGDIDKKIRSAKQKLPRR
jgi:tetratricopeptide (TPR) repeat protein